MRQLLTPQDIHNIEFQAKDGIRYSWYRADEVDEFLDNVEHTIKTLGYEQLDLLTKALIKNKENKNEKNN